jgi:murein L,D-transpeptidase YafK
MDFAIVSAPMRSRFAFAIACAAWLACAKPPAPPPPEPPPAPAETPAASAECPRAERIDVSKSQRSLTVRCEGGSALQFRIALARERGPKRAQGDQRMPEGEYRIAGPARKSRFHLFIPFDYPSPADADLALKDGRISAETHAAVAKAHKAGRLPPQDTPLGGVLGIHGEGARWRGDHLLNWTEGCIGMSDRSIAVLAKLVRPGMPLSIEP